MDDIRAHLIAVLVYIVHIKLFCKQCIPLNCNHGVFLAVHVLRIDVHLRAIERRFPDILHKWDAKLCQNISDMLLGLIPYFRLTDILFPVLWIPFRQMVCHIFIDPQCLETIFCKCKASLKFLHHLVWPDDQMSLRNRKLAHPCQSMHLAGILISEKCGSLTVSAWKVTVRLLGIFIYIILERAGHRTKRIYFLVLLLIAKHKHAFLIMIPVS